MADRRPRQAIPPEPPSEPHSAKAPESRRSVFARSELTSLWSAAGRWSPAGIAAALVLVFLALGGREGVVALVGGLSESLSASKELTAEMVALRGEMEALRKEIKIEREQREEVSAETQRNKHNISLVCDLTAKLNHGKPNESWCAADGRSTEFEPPPPQGDRMPIWKTAAQWQHRAPP